MINENILIDLGVISLLAGAPHRASKQVVDGTFFQDTRLSLESKLLGLINRHFDRLCLWRYLDIWRDHRPGLQAVMDIGDWRAFLEAKYISSRSFERHIRPLYLHREGCYIVNPALEEQMYLYYNLSPQMVIELSRELLNMRVWFLGMHEVFCSEPLGDLVQEVRRKYNNEICRK